MENTNCLEGMRCPKCKKVGKMKIAVIAIALVSDEGTEAFYDSEWNDDSFCQCDECDLCGTVKEFQIKNQETAKMWKELDRQYAEIEAERADNYYPGEEG